MPNDLTRKATANMNKSKTAKYDIEPEKVEKASLEDDNFRENMIFISFKKTFKNLEN